MVPRPVQPTHERRLPDGLVIIIATIPIGVLGFVFKDQIRTGARNLWLMSTILIAFPR